MNYQVPMRVTAVRLFKNQPVALLQSGSICLPLRIHSHDAQAIAAVLEGSDISESSIDRLIHDKYQRGFRPIRIECRIERNHFWADLVFFNPLNEKDEWELDVPLAVAIFLAAYNNLPVMVPLPIIVQYNHELTSSNRLCHQPLNRSTIENINRLLENSDVNLGKWGDES